MKKKITNAIRNGLYEMIKFVEKIIDYVGGIILLTMLALFAVIFLTVAALVVVIIVAPLHAFAEVLEYGDVTSFTSEYVDYIEDAIELVSDVFSELKESKEEAES